MPTLTVEEHRSVFCDALAAGMRADREAAIDAVQPLYAKGDVGDLWILVTSLLGVVSESMPKPAPGTNVSIGFALVDEETGETTLPTDAEGNVIDVPDVVAETKPALVIYMRMLADQIADDPEASLNHWYEAVDAELGGTILVYAIRNAGEFARTRIASQN